MQKMLKHFSSLMVLVIFLILALAQENDEYYEPPPCEEIYENYLNLGYSPCLPIDPPIVRQNSFVLTVKDKQTGAPIQGLYIKVIWNFFIMEKEEDCEKCFARMRGYSIGDSYADVTNASGQIDGLTDFEQYDDLREVQWITFRIEDLTGKYAFYVEYMRFPHDVSSREATVYLINNNAL